MRVTVCGFKYVGLKKSNYGIHILAIRRYADAFYAHLARTRSVRAEKYTERFVSRDRFNFET